MQSALDQFRISIQRVRDLISLLRVMRLNQLLQGLKFPWVVLVKMENLLEILLLG
jgi:hypothetical protein